MIKFDTFELSNGLRFVVHRDPSTPLAVMNILYDVGARDEQPDKTGMAHLMEHLMFSGSVNIPKPDEMLRLAGGENNAFTNNDITNYYLSLPAENIETAFWLESDRMLALPLTTKSFEVQRQVVIEEFRQNYLNQPYGDVWMLLMPLAYKTHPYQWNTIGKDVSQIENMKLKDLKGFYSKFYNPNNAIVSVVGNVQTEQIQQLAEKWFSSIPSGPKIKRELAAEEPQTEMRMAEVRRKVPTNVVYKAWHMPGRYQDNYIALDLVTDLLDSGRSSLLYRELVLKKALFADVDAYVTGRLDPGLLVISGKVSQGVAFEKAVNALDSCIAGFLAKAPSEKLLRKVKNRVETSMVFGDVSILAKAMNLALFTHLGDTNLINTLHKQYRAIKADEIHEAAKAILIETNCTTLNYMIDNEQNS